MADQNQIPKDLTLSNGPYRPVKFEDFIKESPWIKDCQAFVLIGIGPDPEDKNNAYMNFSNSEISHDLMAYVLMSFLYHQNLKTDTQEIVLLTKDRGS